MQLKLISFQAAVIAALQTRDETQQTTIFPLNFRFFYTLYCGFKGIIRCVSTCVMYAFRGKYTFNTIKYVLYVPPLYRHPL